MEFTEQIMRPPQEAHSLVMRVIQGCTWNKCNFCYISRGHRMKVVPVEEIIRQAEASKPFLPAKTKIYLAGSNPFALSMRRLEEYAVALRGVYPEFSRISMQTRIDDIGRKTDDELRRLLDLGISHLYIGTENGNEKVLKMMNKGHTARDTVEQLRRLDEAGITYTSFYVLGLGGKGLGKESGEATAAMFNQVHPERITTTGLTLFPGIPVSHMAEKGEFEEASEREKIEELHAFLSALRINTFYDGIHYLNPVHYRFNTSDAGARAEVIADMEEILATHSDEELEKIVNRRQMVSL